MSGAEPELERVYAAYRAHASPSEEQRDALWAALEERLEAPADAPEIPARSRGAASWRTFAAAALLLAAAAVLLLGDEGRELTNRNRDTDPHSAEFGSRTDETPQPSTQRVPDPPDPPRPRAHEEVDAPTELAPLEWIAPAPESEPPLTPARPGPAAPRPPKPERVAAAPKAPPIVEEAALLQAARSALARREPDRALARLREHARKFEHGVLVEERHVLEVRAWCRLGELDEARRAALALVATSPGSGWAARVHRPCEDEP